MGIERKVPESWDRAGLSDHADRALATAIVAATAGRFRLRRPLGRGGMGVVWEADDAVLGERVALKTLQHIDARALLRFKNEFRAVRDVHHPNLVRLGELFDAEGTWFFTMELVHGRDLLSFLRGRSIRGDEPTVLAQGQSGPRQVASRPPPPLDDDRLRSTFAQVAMALAALHDHRLIHRDVKPGNIRVTPEGRAVLLDFGLVADAEMAPSVDGAVVGTISYMAPEQAAGGAVGPSADWYAFGTTLYEVLTGRVPFQGTPVQVILDKQRLVPEPARSVVLDVAGDLDALCCGLLAFDPQKRPTAAEILQVLGDSTAPLQTSQSGNAPLFVGRESELAVMRDAFEEVASTDTPITLLLHGESGIGKSALATWFCAEAQAYDALILRGQCYEHESLPYKALDGVIDSLAAALQRMTKTEAAGSVPRHARLLMRLFPVLERVEAFRVAPEARGESTDPMDQRRYAFGALRELFARISERHRVVVVIDDVQWSDPDGIDLLRTLLAAPEPPAILVVLTSPVDHVAGTGDEWPTRLQPLPLAPLDTRAATELARGLLGQPTKR